MSKLKERKEENKHYNEWFELNNKKIYFKIIVWNLCCCYLLFECFFSLFYLLSSNKKKFKEKPTISI